MKGFNAHATPGEYDVQVCLEMENGGLTDWQPGRVIVDDEFSIHLVSTHDWEVQVPKSTSIQSYRIRGLTFSASLDRSIYIPRSRPTKRRRLAGEPSKSSTTITLTPH